MCGLPSFLLKQITVRAGSKQAHDLLKEMGKNKLDNDSQFFYNEHIKRD